MQRREVVKAGMVLLSTATTASIFSPVGVAKEFRGGEPWHAEESTLPDPVTSDERVFFSQREARLVSAIFDRLIPADELSVSATEAGCVTFIDHQLAGPYGQAASRYTLGPVKLGTPAQGTQTLTTPAEIYRAGLSALDEHCRQRLGKAFIELCAEQQDAYLEKMEAGEWRFHAIDAAEFFALLLGNAKEGFLADPIYGGNRDMAGWKMVGFPGARYDYRDYIERKGEVIDLKPISLLDIT
ncbi:gluconate 2-dehydrogenase subunit 3 family protein [Halomonas sp. HNIBRBA4712]|uniref:gluconate 2-dehydrogenase subunit 3 family protein n=1 Tax=Halomonas sp. HNIBRBA4712 TaxID=3373087 RepID=UPI0037469679